MKKIISNVRNSVIPTKSQEKSKAEIADLAFKLVQSQLKKFPEVINLEFGGSFAKGTWLPKNADVDIFIKFKKETSEEQFVKISKKIGFDFADYEGGYEEFLTEFKAFFNNPRRFTYSPIICCRGEKI